MTARKLVHVAFGLPALATGLLTRGQLLAFLAAALLHNVLLLPRYSRGRLDGPGARVLGHDLGIVLYPAVLLALAIALPGRHDLVAVAWTVLAFGDGAAALAGRRWPGSPLPWNPRKSWAGSAAFVAGGTAGAATALLLVPGADGQLRTAAAALLAGLGAALAAAAVESLDSAVDDNLLVPPVAAAAASGLLAFDSAALTLHPGAWAGAAAANLGLAGVALAAGAASPSGAVAGVLLGATLWIALGPAGYLPFLTFVVLGSAATRMGLGRKERLGIEEPRRGRRGAANALANAGVAALLAVAAAASAAPARARLFALGSAASLAAALADTLASEIGKARAGRTLRLVTFERVAPGTDGGVSAAGSLAALAGALAGALAAAPLLGGSVPLLALVAAGGAAGMLADGVAGALLRAPRPADNHVVNVIGTLAGALVAMSGASLVLEPLP